MLTVQNGADRGKKNPPELQHPNTNGVCFVFPLQERRIEKKANTVAFKQEKQKQEKQMVGLRANVQGMKLS